MDEKDERQHDQNSHRGDWRWTSWPTPCSQSFLMSDVSLVGVVDAHAETARHVADLCQTKPFSEPGDLLDKVDAVVVAVPTANHASVAGPFLKRGVSTLVEKPISFSVDQPEIWFGSLDRIMRY